MVNRVTGLASGMDTEAMVKQMMALSQSKYDNIMKKKTETEWKKQLYNDIYEQLRSFDNQLFDATRSKFNSPKTTTISNEALATVTASANASNISHTFSVESLATIASMGSSGAITKAGGDKNGNLSEKLGFEGSAKITLSSGDKTAEIEITDDMTMSDLAKAINDAGKAAGIDVKATYDTNTDRLLINSTTMGQAAGFSLTAADSKGTELMDALKLGSAGNAEAKGSDAVVKLDGVTFNFDKNDFTIDGLNFSLKSAAPGQTSLISVKSDNTQLVDNVKNFVKAYNDLIELINGKTSEKYYRDYDPISDEQRKEMSEKEIELWEEKAKSGLLRNDNTLTSLTSKMRTAMYSPYKIDGNFTTMSSIGISTKNYQEKGKLTIDEDKLMKALEEDPDAVAKLFNGGLVDTLRSDIKSAMTKMEQTGGAGKIVDTQSPWAKEISRYSNQLDTLSAKMLKEENRYYTQFAAMEKALSNMNSSSSYITSMLGGS